MCRLLSRMLALVRRGCIACLSPQSCFRNTDLGAVYMLNVECLSHCSPIELVKHADIRNEGLIFWHGKGSHHGNAQELLQNFIRGHAGWQNSLDVIVETLEASGKKRQRLFIIHSGTEEVVKCNKSRGRLFLNVNPL